MKPLFLAALVIAVLLAGCARHVVTPREGGRVDGKTSTMTTSDERWNVHKEPTAP
jgi:hypothetical protein